MPRRFINLNHSIHSHSSAIIRRLLTNAEKTRNRFFGVTGLFLAIFRDRSNRLKHPIKKSQPAQLFEGKGKLQQKEPGNENRRHFRHRGLQKKTRFKKSKMQNRLRIKHCRTWKLVGEWSRGQSKLFTLIGADRPRCWPKHFRTFHSDLDSRATEFEHSAVCTVLKARFAVKIRFV